MSFGFSPSDITALIQLTTRVCNGWKNACGRYTSITYNLGTLQSLLSRIHHEATLDSSVFSKETGDFDTWRDLQEGCKQVVSELENVLTKYKGLSKSRGRNWDRIRLGTKDLRELNRRLVNRTANLSTFVSTLGMSSQGRVENELLPELIQKVDDIAAQLRAGNESMMSARSVWTEHEGDDKQIWREFRRSLITSGFRGSDIHKHSAALRLLLFRLHRDGMLEEEIPRKQDHEKSEIYNEMEEKISKEKEVDAGDEIISNEPEMNASWSQDFKHQAEDQISEDIYEDRYVSDEIDPPNYLPDKKRARSPENPPQHGPRSKNKPRHAEANEQRTKEDSNDDDNAWQSQDAYPYYEDPLTSDYYPNRHQQTFNEYDNSTYDDPIQNSEYPLPDSYRNYYPYQYNTSIPPQSSYYGPSNPPGPYHSAPFGSSPNNYNPYFSPEKSNPLSSSPDSHNPFLNPKEASASRFSSDYEPSHTYEPHLHNAIDWPYPKDMIIRDKNPSMSICQKPTLPEGWDWRTEWGEPFYIDTYARNPERRCFSKSPVREKEDAVIDRPELGWVRVCTVFGRIYWKHKKEGFIAYRNPSVFPMMVVDKGYLFLKYENGKVQGKNGRGQEG